MDIRRFLKKCSLLDSPDTTAVSKVPRLAGDDSISTPMNSQEGKVIMRIPHSHSSPLLKFHQLHCHKIQRLLKFLAAKVPLRGEKLKFQPHWQKKYSWLNYNSVTNGMLCQYCSHIYKEDREELKHTQCAWISFPMSNWNKALDKMKTHEPSAWRKMEKGKVEAEKQSQAEEV